MYDQMPEDEVDDGDDDAQASAEQRKAQYAASEGEQL